MPDRHILAFARADLPAPWLPERGALRIGSAELAEALAPLRPVWLPRAAAEEDPSHQQPIPYVLVRHGTRLACYRRQGTEQRLHGLRSVGVGGHVEVEDAANSLLDTLLSAARRELREEFLDLTGAPPLHVLGIINEDLTPVGRVHLGVAMLAEIDTRMPPRGGAELLDLDWLTPSVARQCPLEYWSQLALDLLAESRFSP
jgi:predicted NUDIX family phosphoesterase